MKTPRVSADDLKRIAAAVGIGLAAYFGHDNGGKLDDLQLKVTGLSKRIDSLESRSFVNFLPNESLVRRENKGVK